VAVPFTAQKAGKLGRAPLPVGVYEPAATGAAESTVALARATVFSAVVEQSSAVGVAAGVLSDDAPSPPPQAVVAIARPIAVAIRVRR
jgi:hypothetical protein